jgi:opacity protein-like surface antigen
LKFTKAIFAAGALSLASVSAAALAQDATAEVEVTAGTVVYGPEGNEVGTVESVADGVATFNTGTHKIGLPVDRFGQNAEKQTTIAVTRDALNKMVEDQLAQAAAQLESALVVGAPVVDVNGVSLGAVGKVEGEDVTVETEWGAFALKKANFQPGEGGVTAQVLADQVKTALGAS